jgi:hypothetical protein
MDDTAARASVLSVALSLGLPPADPAFGALIESERASTLARAEAVAGCCPKSAEVSGGAGAK